MEIVIEISEEMYKDIQSHDWKNEGRWYSEEWKAIHNGTPLPKGHGVLKDTDEIKKKQFTLGTSNYCEYKVVTIEAIDKADTIIEADNKV